MSAEKINELIIKALSNKERKYILNIISSHPDGINYTGILNEIKLSTGRLNYHLGELAGLFEKDEEKNYKITALGRKALDVQGYIDKKIDKNDLNILYDLTSEPEKKSTLNFGYMLNSLNRIHFSIILIIGLIIGGSLGVYSGLNTNHYVNQKNIELQLQLSDYNDIINDNNYAILVLEEEIEQLTRTVSDLNNTIENYVLLVSTLEYEKELLQHKLSENNITILDYLQLISTIKELIQTLPKQPEFGVNFISTSWHYEPYYLSDDELTRDLIFFKNEGISNIILPIIWKYMEPEPFSYNDEALRDLVRVCDFAEKYGIKVIFDFHTMMNTSSFTMPEWLEPRKFETVFLNETSRSAWLSYLDYCVSYLSNETTNIHSWHMMNEPYRTKWACDVTIDEFIILWQEMKNIFTTYSDKPVSIRFGTDSIKSHFEYAPEIFEICDYISINWYEEHCSIGNLTEILSVIGNRSNVIISEFGINTTKSYISDLDQATKIREYIILFQKLGIEEWYSWLWRADHNYGVPNVPGTGLNLALNADGTPKLALYLLSPNYDLILHDSIIENINSILTEIK